jgi:hypothetical protein
VIGLYPWDGSGNCCIRQQSTACRCCWLGRPADVSEAYSELWSSAAVEAFRAALQEYTRERVPLQWAGTQNNLGNALATLGVRTHDRAKLEEARKAVNAAFEVVMQVGQEHRLRYFEHRLREIDGQLAVQ